MNEIIESPQTYVAPQTPMSIMAIAVEKGASVESLERMWELQVMYEKRQAEKAFVSAMAEFKKNQPEIFKDKEVSFGNTHYFHATHYGVTKAIVEGLSKHGISHRWDVEQKDGKIAVTCVLTHRDGHSQATRLEAGYDTSGGKNSIQAIMSAKTYLERHSLLAATGLSTSDMPDDDGRAVGGGQDLLDAWVYKANSATSLADLHQIQKDANAAFREAKDVDGWNSFKAVYADCKAVLGAAK